MTDFMQELQEIYDRINEHGLDEVKKYMRMYCALDIIDIHRYYRQNILNLSNDDPIKMQCDLILGLLGIPYIKLPCK